jgi:DNA-binding transcriptional regulator YiaG
MKNDVERAPTGGRILPAYVDRLMGVRALLIESAFEVEHDGTKGIVVPDVNGLQIAAAVARAIVPAKLTGKEIRFLRKAIGMRAADLARFLDVTAETMSRWENDREVINTNA